MRVMLTLQGVHVMGWRSGAAYINVTQFDLSIYLYIRTSLCLQLQSHEAGLHLAKSMCVCVQIIYTAQVGHEHMVHELARCWLEARTRQHQ